MTRAKTRLPSKARSPAQGGGLLERLRQCFQCRTPSCSRRIWRSSTRTTMNTTTSSWLVYSKVLHSDLLATHAAVHSRCHLICVCTVQVPAELQNAKGTSPYVIVY